MTLLRSCSFTKPWRNYIRLEGNSGNEHEFWLIFVEVLNHTTMHSYGSDQLYSETSKTTLSHETKWANERSEVHERSGVHKRSEQGGASKWVCVRGNRQTSSSVLTSRFLAVLNHYAYCSGWLYLRVTGKELMGDKAELNWTKFWWSHFFKANEDVIHPWEIRCQVIKRMVRFSKKWRKGPVPPRSISFTKVCCKQF